MKYKVGDKVKIVSLQSVGRGLCQDVVGDVGEIIYYDSSDTLRYKVKIEDGGSWWWEESNLELIEDVKPNTNEDILGLYIEQRNYREMNPNDLITISIEGVESEVPLGDIVHAVAILGVTNGYHGARIWKALRKPFDTECFVEDVDTVVEFRDKQKEALDYFFQPYYDKQQQEKDELKTLIASKMEEVDALVKQLNQLNQM